MNKTSMGRKFRGIFHEAYIVADLQPENSDFQALRERASF